MTTLLELTLRGAAVAAIVLVLDLALGRWMAARHRRMLWLAAPFAFLVPVAWRLPVLPADSVPASSQSLEAVVRQMNAVAAMPAAQALHLDWLLVVWGAGAIAGAVVVLVRTLRASRRWDECRFSTDTALLEAVEDCRRLAGVRAPVGVVVSDRIESPALLGWLRPKLLLPAGWLERCPPAQLRDVLLHELAHLRGGDLAWGWLFTAMRLAHWFNPLAHLAAWRWHVAREDAADEFALRLRGKTADSYGETLLAFLRGAHGPQPFGAIGISENFLNLKHRIHMIQQHPRPVLPPVFAGFLIAALALGIFLRPTVAAGTSEESEKKAAVEAMMPWLKLSDDGDYAKMWSEASALFRKAVTQDQWVTMGKQVRTPLGACKSRELGSVLIQDGSSLPAGQKIDGKIAIAQFKTSFANLLSAIETVTFQLEPDGKWRAAGYYIKPAL